MSVDRLARAYPRPVPNPEGRVPPNDMTAEACVLTSILLGENIERVADIISEADFYSPAHASVYAAVIELWRSGQPVDVVTVAGWLSDRDQLQRVGGRSYIAKLANEAPTVYNVEAYAERVVSKARLRKAIDAHHKFAAQGYGDVSDPQEWLDGAAYELGLIARPDEKSRFVLAGDAVAATFQRIFKAAGEGSSVTGTPTGYTAIDRKTGGLQPGDLTIVAGRPGMGKTSLAMQIALNVAALEGCEAAVFSLEMPTEQLAMRLMCSEARVDLGKARNGRLQPEDWGRLTDAGAFIAGKPLWIDDTSAIKPIDLRARVMRIKAAAERRAEAERKANAATSADVAKPIGRALKLVVVDYVQLMNASGMVSSESTREREVSALSGAMKQLAKDASIHVMALSQLNRAPEIRTGNDRRPRLADLRDSGSLEQDADNVILMYRDEYYNPESRERGIAEAIVAKQRNGPTGRTRLRFTSSCARFDNLAPGEGADEEED
jgi:replicative DNA helicase